MSFYGPTALTEQAPAIVMGGQGRGLEHDLSVRQSAVQVNSQPNLTGQSPAALAWRGSWSSFASERDNRPAPQDGDLPALIAAIETDNALTTKSGPAWSPARYTPGAKRGNVKVLGLCALVLDLDHMTAPQVEALRARLRGLGLLALWYKTPSHTETAPRWRCILPTARELTVAEHRALLGALLEDAPGADRATDDPARLFFGCRNGTRAEVDDGTPLDVDALLASTPAPMANPSTAMVAPAPLADGPILEHQRNNTLTSIAGKLRRVGAGPEAILTELRQVNQRCVPPLPENELGPIAASVAKYPTGAESLAQVEHALATSTEETRAGALLAWARVAVLSPAVDRECSIDRIKATLKKMGCQSFARLVDAALGQARSELPKDTTAPEDDFLAPTIPADDPVDGNELLTRLYQTIERHLFVMGEQILVIALWIIHTHAIGAAFHAPILALTSATKRCGKTTALNIISELVEKALSASNVSDAVLYRSIEEFTPTLLIDECDNLLHDRPELLGMLNCGHSQKNAIVLRCGTKEQNFEPQRFNVFCCKCLAAIGTLPPTLADRSIDIRMQRKPVTVRVARITKTDVAILGKLKSQIARWVQDHVAALHDADPAMPKALNDRARDNFRPLFAIADLIHPEVGQAVRDSSLILQHENPETGELLLLSLRDLFEQKKSDRLASTVITTALNQDEEQPWRDFNRGQGMTTRDLAKALAEFGIRAKTIRMSSGGTARGYLQEDFGHAWARYVPPSAPPLLADSSETVTQTKPMAHLR